MFFSFVIAGISTHWVVLIKAYSKRQNSDRTFQGRNHGNTTQKRKGSRTRAAQKPQSHPFICVGNSRQGKSHDRASVWTNQKHWFVTWSEVVITVAGCSPCCLNLAVIHFLSSILDFLNIKTFLSHTSSVSYTDNMYMIYPRWKM